MPGCASTKWKSISFDIEKEFIAQKENGEGNIAMGRDLGLSESSVRTIWHKSKWSSQSLGIPFPLYLHPCRIKVRKTLFDEHCSRTMRGDLISTVWYLLRHFTNLFNNTTSPLKIYIEPPPRGMYKVHVVEPRVTNESSWTNWFTYKFSEQKMSLVTSVVSSDEHASWHHIGQQAESISRRASVAV